MPPSEASSGIMAGTFEEFAAEVPMEDNSCEEESTAQLTRPLGSTKPRSTWPSTRAVAVAATMVAAAVALLGAFWHASPERGRYGLVEFAEEKWPVDPLGHTCRLFPGKRIVLATANSDYVPMFNNWLKSVAPHLSDEVDHVVVVAHDLPAGAALRQLSADHADLPNFTVLQADELVTQRKLQSLEADTEGIVGMFDFLSDGYANIVNKRPNLLGHFLQQGCTVLYNDVDMVWQKNFFAELRRYGTGHDLYVANDHCEDVYNESMHDLCTGFLYVKPRPQMLQLMEAWAAEIADKPRNQPGFNDVLWSMMTNETVHWFKLPFNEHPPGCKADEHPNATVIHANWVKPPDLEHKIAFFEELGLWNP